MGQIKNIKLHIVTDIKVEVKDHTHDEDYKRRCMSHSWCV